MGKKLFPEAPVGGHSGQQQGAGTATWSGKAKEESTRQIAVMKVSDPHTMEHRGTVPATQRDNDGWGAEIT